MRHIAVICFMCSGFFANTCIPTFAASGKLNEEVQMHTSVRSSSHRRRRAVPLTLALVVVALALPASALAAAFKVVPHIHNHTPTANKKWPIALTVTKGSKKLSGSVKYEFLFDGSVVSHQAGKKFTDGIYKDELLFPSTAVGNPLTLRIIVTTKYGKQNVNWAVNTKK
jgi:hypothetical protein